jgi:hypothetical protein
MNAINYWNLVYLSDKLNHCRQPAERDGLLRAILRTNTHTWHHVNLQGEYDFSEEYATTVLFDLTAWIDSAADMSINGRVTTNANGSALIN